MSETMKLKIKRWAWLGMGGFAVVSWAYQVWVMTDAGDRSDWGQLIWHGFVAICSWFCFRMAWRESRQAYTEIKKEKSER